jgi:membrane protein DedA with SNARE-associated domain
VTAITAARAAGEYAIVMDPLGTLIPSIAVCGALSLAGATFLERLIPVLPSTVLLVLIGIAAAEGYFSLPAAVALSVLGSLLGCLAFYGLGVAVGEDRSRRLLERSARLFGISSARFGRWVDRFRANERSIALGAQLVPAVRLIAPAISGLLRVRFWRFVSATALGAALWNSFFIAVGYVAACGASDANASALAVKTLVALIAVEALGLVTWRLTAPLRRAARAGSRPDR